MNAKKYTLMKSRSAHISFQRAAIQALGTLLLLALQVFFPVQATAQGWQRSFGGEKTDEGWAVLQTEDHGFIVVGFGESFGSDNDQDIFVIRTDVDGRVLWTSYFDEGYQEQARAILRTPDGHYLIVGIIVNEPGAGDNILLLKINRKGEKIWSKQFGSDRVERANAAVLDQDGSILVSGFVRKADEDEDMFLAKFDASGNAVWFRQYGTAKQDEGTAVGILPGGDVILAGNSRNEKGFDNDIVLYRIAPSTGAVVWQKRIGEPYREEVRDLLIARDGNIVIAGLINDNTDAYVAKFTPDGEQLWERIVGEQGKEEEASAITELRGGELVLTGLKLTDLVNVDVFIAQLSADGALQWENNIGDPVATEEGRDIQATADGGFIIAGYNAQVLTSFNNLILVKTDGRGEVTANFLTGRVFLDEDNQCDFDPGERPLEGWLVQAERAGTVFYGTTGADGSFRIPVDTGRYNLRALPLNLYWDACLPQGITVEIKEIYDSVRVDFPMRPGVLCPFLEVGISTPFLAPCSDLEYTVSYCNIGTARADGVYVDVSLDAKITFVSASVPHARLPDGKYRFQIGSLNPAVCGAFRIKAQMACSGIAEGQAALVSARIFPDTTCLRPDPNWDMSSLGVKGQCEGDSIVVFQIRNNGVGDMQSARRSIVIQDNIVLRQFDVLLKAEEEETVRIPANGATFRTVVEQSAGHPGRSYPTAVVEGCVTDGLPSSAGYVTMFPEDDLDPFVGIDVQEIVASILPVELRGHPKGYRDSIIAAETDLTFKVLFKNTGSDTVTQIVIRDTLPPGLDPRKVTPGPSNLGYRLEVYGNGIIRITMSNVSLPPAQPNSTEGFGFVEFRVGQRANNPLKTVLENRATVYFDDQPPVTTRTLRYVVDRWPDFITVVTSAKEVFYPGVLVKAYPNPSPESVTFEIEGQEFKQVQLTVFSLDGRVVDLRRFSGRQLVWNRNQLKGGTYLYRLEAEGRLINTGKLILR